MIQLRKYRNTIFSLCVTHLWFMTGCGANNTRLPINNNIAPIFTSTPSTSAQEGVPYTYQISATTTAGVNMTFALATAPDGATLDGTTIQWTPTPQQSRNQNFFLVTATSEGGAISRQGWSIVPTGTVTVKWIDTYWNEHGPAIFIPFTSNSIGPLNLINAEVPQPDGTFLALHATDPINGVFTIANVPGGYFWLTIGLRDALWTQASNIDVSSDYIGYPQNFNNNLNEIDLDLNFNGMDPLQPQDWINFSSGDSFPFFILSALPANDPIGATQWGFEAVGEGALYDSIPRSFYAFQYEPATNISIPALVLGKEVEFPVETFTTSAENFLTGNMNPTPQKSIRVNVKGSEWPAILNQTTPAPITPAGSVLTIDAQPYVIDANANPSQNIMGPNFTLMGPATGNLTGWSNSTNSCIGEQAYDNFIQFPGTNDIIAPNATQPSILTDQDYGTVTYGDPFPDAWQRTFTFCQFMDTEIPIPGTNATAIFVLPFGQMTTLPEEQVEPLLSGVQAPTVNGADLLTATTLNTGIVTLQWSAPKGMKPYGYFVQPYIQVEVEILGPNQTLTTYPTYYPMSYYGTAGTSMTVPNLASGRTFVFVITAVADGSANMETQPFRSKLPRAYSNIVSAPITIAASATNVAQLDTTVNASNVGKFSVTGNNKNTRSLSTFRSFHPQVQPPYSIKTKTTSSGPK